MTSEDVEELVEVRCESLCFTCRDFALFSGNFVENVPLSLKSLMKGLVGLANRKFHKFGVGMSPYVEDMRKRIRHHFHCTV